MIHVHVTPPSRTPRETGVLSNSTLLLGWESAAPEFGQRSQNHYGKREAAPPVLSAYIHEILLFPNRKRDDQVDSTSQAPNWFKERAFEPGIVTHYRLQAEQRKQEENTPPRFTREWYYRNYGVRPLNRL